MMLKDKRFSFGLVYFLFTMLIYSVMDTWAKFLLVNIHMVQIIWIRYSIHAVLLGIIVITQGQVNQVLHPPHLRLQLLRAICLLGVTVNMYFALQHLHLTNVTALVSVAPFVVAIGAKLLLNETVSRSGWIAIVTGFLGAMIIIRPGAGISHWASGISLLAAFCFAGQQLISRFLAINKGNQWATLFITASVASLILVPFLPSYWQPIQSGPLISIALIGIFAALGDICLLRSYTHTSVSSLAPFTFSMILFSSILGWLWLGDLPDLPTIIGAIIIVSSGLVLLLYRQKFQGLAEVETTTLASFPKEKQNPCSVHPKPFYTETTHPALHYERMIGDQPRMNRYRQAIEQTVKPGDIVADLGTGLGILAMMAAKAGAKKVYAIDLNPNSIWMAKQLALENKVADKIEFITANAQEALLPEKVDVIVNELIGEFGNEEGIIETTTKFAANNLLPKGAIIPSEIKTYLIPVEYKNSFRHGWRKENAGLDLSLPMQLPLKEQAIKYYLDGRQKELCEAQLIEDRVFGGKDPVNRPSDVYHSFTITQSGLLHGFIGYFDATLAPGIRLCGYPRYEGCHWENWNWPINPHTQVEPGDSISVHLIASYQSGTEQFVKTKKDTASGWEPKYDWTINWHHSPRTV